MASRWLQQFGRGDRLADIATKTPLTSPVGAAQLQKLVIALQADFDNEDTLDGVLYALSNPTLPDSAAGATDKEGQKDEVEDQKPDKQFEDMVFLMRHLQDIHFLLTFLSSASYTEADSRLGFATNPGGYISWMGRMAELVELAGARLSVTCSGFMNADPHLWHFFITGNAAWLSCHGAASSGAAIAGLLRQCAADNGDGLDQTRGENGWAILHEWAATLIKPIEKTLPAHSPRQNGALKNGDLGNGELKNGELKNGVKR